MDGALDPSLLRWTSLAGADAPLRSDVLGNLLCPLCARNQRGESLIAVTPRLHGCARGHRYRSAGS